MTKPTWTKPLTKAQADVLRVMQKTGEELVYSAGVGYVGLRQVSRSVVMGLLQKCALRADQFSDIDRGDVERYTINETGRKLLEEFDE